MDKDQELQPSYKSQPLTFSRILPSNIYFFPLTNWELVVDIMPFTPNLSISDIPYQSALIQFNSDTILLFNIDAQSCLTLCSPMDYSPPSSSVHGNFPSKNIGVGCHALLQAIFPTQGLNPCLLHCRRILYCLSHQGSPYKYINFTNCSKKLAVFFPPLHVVFNPRPCTAFSCLLSLLFFHLEQSQSLAFFISIFLRPTS